MNKQVTCTCPSGDGSLRWPCPAHPPAEGLDTVDCTNVLIGNTDIAVPEHVPTDVTPGVTPLPIYPQHGDLPETISCP